MKTALAAALLALTVSGAEASTIRDHDDRYAMVQDVVKAVRCAPPKHCRQGRPLVRHYRKAVAQKRSLVRGFVREVRKALPGPNRLAGVVPTLAAKALEIVGACGSTVISGVRHTYVAGTRHISLHASGRAFDIAGNPGCIYAHLRGWPGGVSIDYARVRHVHVSYAPGGREWGVRFAHGGRHHHSTYLLARRHFHRRHARRR